jgi:3-oxoacyl-[acyl-carrier-protein] synthase II
MAVEQVTPYRNIEHPLSPEFEGRRVVLTGIDMITPLGNDTETTWKRLQAGDNGIRTFDIKAIAEKAQAKELINMKTNITIAGISDINPREELEKILSPELFKTLDWGDYSFSALLALLTSTRALNSAGLLGDKGIDDTIDNKRFGIIQGTMIGGLGLLSNVYQKIIKQDPTNRVKPNDTFRAAAERVATAPSMALGARGPVQMVSAACASGALAIVNAADKIKAGRADVMLAGGVDGPIEPVEIVMFDTVRALTRKSDPDIACRPFDEGHSGFVMAEGACTLVLESEEHALRRNANIIAVLGGYSELSDAYHKSFPNGYAARESFRDTLLQTGIPNPDQGGIYNNAHGTSTLGDGIELDAIKSVRDELPHQVDLRVSSSKSMIGHTMGAAGAIEAGIAALTLRDGVAHPTRNLEHVIPEGESMNLVPNDAQVMNIEVATSGSFGFGGPGVTIGWTKHKR